MKKTPRLNRKSLTKSKTSSPGVFGGSFGGGSGFFGRGSPLRRRRWIGGSGRVFDDRAEGGRTGDVAVARKADGRKKHADIGENIAELAGRFSGISVRVPVSTVSLVDFVVLLKQTVSATQINEALERYAQESLKDILAISHEPLVSSDFKGDSHSSIVDAPFTEVTGGRLARVLAWYDNEWGYACRVADLAVYMGEKAA